MPRNLLLLSCVATQALAALTAASSYSAESLPTPVRVEKAGPFAMRGLGNVSASGQLWRENDTEVALVTFVSENPEKARVLASKYSADLTAYSISQAIDSEKGGASWDIAGLGRWTVGVDGNLVRVLSGPEGSLRSAVARSVGAASWRTPEKAAHPKYLDSFDNYALAFWWMPSTKPEEVLQFAREIPGAINAHPHSSGTRSSLAPDVYDYSVPDNIIAQAHLLGKPYRLMIWGGLPPWWARSIGDSRNHIETALESAQPSRDLAGADGYYATQIGSPEASGVETDVMEHIMNRYKDDDSLLGWLEPHGEFFLSDPRRVPPNAAKHFVKYLQTEKGLSLEQANAAYGTDAKSWEEFPYPEMAWFFGRRGEFLDLDERPWRWQPGISREAGVAQGIPDGSFDDRGWPEDLRTSRRLLNQFRASGQTAPLWFRFTSDVPPALTAEGRRVYLHVMPYTENAGKPLEVWVNGKTAGEGLTDSKHYQNKHTVFDVTDLVKPGANQFAIFSLGGRIVYRTFLSHVPYSKFPFPDKAVNRFWMDWNDFLIAEKLETLRKSLMAMREIDPNRPIKVMTPHMFQSEAMDLMEAYGAYPQLTGSGAFYRPMHYKGYARLRGLPSSSEGGGPARDARQMQYTFATIFWENQDAHDYVFDIERDLWSRPDVVEWVRSNRPLLKTLGKVDFAPATIGVLRDVQQTERYLNDDIWNWDLSRGPLPSAGLSPVLVDGPDLDKGLADHLPVILDCATTVMTPERVAAILRYVKNGGTFVAQFNTGRHTPSEPNSWPLAQPFGLKVSDFRLRDSRVHDWPLAKMTFTSEQNLLPSLRGKTMEGSGISFDHTGAGSSGAIRLDGGNPSVKPIANWEGGGMAVCEASYGKGRLIWIGSPFHVRFRDVDGKFVNEKDRQALFEELLIGLGVELSSHSSDPRVWIERRESKNGLYDVFITCAFNQIRKDWSFDDKTVTDLTFGDAPGKVAWDITQETPLPLNLERGENHSAVLKAQTFVPYQVRQYLVPRREAGLTGPIHWLEIQARTWRALTPVLPKTTARASEIAREQGRKLGQAGLDLTDAWKVRRFTEEPPKQDGWTQTGFDDSSWEPGNLGTWLANGWRDNTAVQYRRTVKIPPEWTGRRVFLCFKSSFHSMGVKDSGKLWLNGEPINAAFANPMVVDITDAAAKGSLDLAAEVLGKPMTGGPGATLYLWAVPKPAETLDLDGVWDKAVAWHQTDGQVSLPGKVEGAFGLRRKFELPANWKGRIVRLVIDQDQRSPVVQGALFNQTGYFNSEADGLAGYGVRVDQWLKPGVNEIDLYVPGHTSFQNYFQKGIPKMNGILKGVRLESYEQSQL